MKAQAFRDWLQTLSKLTAHQRDQVEAMLHQSVPDQHTENFINRRADELHACPHCYSGDVLLWGKDSGIQRYRCRSCRKTFNALTGTPLAHLRRRDAWLTYGQALIDGLSVRKAAAVVRCSSDHGVSLAPPHAPTARQRKRQRTVNLGRSR